MVYTIYFIMQGKKIKLIDVTGENNAKSFVENARKVHPDVEWNYISKEKFMR